MLSQITFMEQCVLLQEKQSLRASSASAARAKVDYEIGTRHIRFSEAACAQLATPWAGACPKDGHLVVHESHQDCVTRLPEGSTLLASSGDTRVEVWSQGDHVLCIQGRTRMLAGRPCSDTVTKCMAADSHFHPWPGACACACVACHSFCMHAMYRLCRGPLYHDKLNFQSTWKAVSLRWKSQQHV